MIQIEKRLQYANGYLDLGMTKEATVELNAIPEAERPDPAVRSMFIRLYLEAKKWRKMAEASKALAEVSPENAFGWTNWAYALRELNQHKQAKDVATDALLQHPNEAVLWFNLACYCSLLGEVQEASNHLDKAIGLEKHFESEAVDDPDLDNLWNWIRAQEG